MKTNRLNKAELNIDRESESGIKGGLAEKIVRFSGFLKHRGFQVFQSSVIDANRSVLEIDLSRKEDFLSVLRANLASNSLEWGQFRDLFKEFWDEKPEVVEKEKATCREERMENEKGHSANTLSSQKQQTEHDALNGELINDLDLGQPQAVNDCEGYVSQVVGCSSDSSIQQKDFSRLDLTDVKIAHLEIKKMMQSFRLHTSRRFKRCKGRGVVDLQKTIRKGIINDGVPAELVYKRKKKKLKKLVVLADVSGSMDRYAQFIMPFVLGFRGTGSKVQVFVFSTSLSCITPYIRNLSLEKALRQISQGVRGWSGGTRIGHSFQQFNRTQANKLLTGRTVILILSDGMEYWGEAGLLGKEMAALSKRAYCIIWLNPKAADPFYKPVYQGMAAALPYVDHFLPADSLQSLKKVGKLLTTIMAS